jgi:hypothetical protein
VEVRVSWPVEGPRLKAADGGIGEWELRLSACCVSLCLPSLSAPLHSVAPHCLPCVPQRLKTVSAMWLRGVALFPIVGHVSLSSGRREPSWRHQLSHSVW